MKGNFRRGIIIAFFLINITFVAKADQPGTAYQYDQYSQNEAVYFRTIPFYWLDLTDFGKTTVYETKTNKLLYKVDNYMPIGAYISNNGKTIISTIDWIGQRELEKEDVITVFINGKKVKRYSIGSFMDEKLTLSYTTSHAFWYKNIFMHNDTLFIHTLDEQAILIDGNSGNILKIEDEEFLLAKVDVKNNPRSKRIIYDSIKYPERYSSPYLKSGETLSQSLLKFLGKKNAENYDSAIYYLSVAVTIDRAGNGTIFYLHATDKKENNVPDMEKRVQAWIRRQKFRTDSIPLNADKWVFENNLYLL